MDIQKSGEKKKQKTFGTSVTVNRVLSIFLWCGTKKKKKMNVDLVSTVDIYMSESNHKMHKINKINHKMLFR